MRITLEIDANDLKQIQKITGQKKKSRAISSALGDYLRMRESRAFIEKALAGQTDYALTNAELEAGDVYETRCVSPSSPRFRSFS
jgi:Arc/MetJ family transcription regulator